jgi:hypothetical protein
MKTPFAVGLLVLVGFGLLIGFTLFLTGERLRNRGEVFETYIRESVQGLEVGAAVRFRGVALGRVTEIALVSSRYEMDPRVQFSNAFQLVLVRFTVDVRQARPTGSLEDAVRLGLRMVKGLSADMTKDILERRGNGYADMRSLWLRRRAKPRSQSRRHDAASTSAGRAPQASRSSQYASHWAAGLLTARQAE